ncbi:uncharacterized protein MONOS_14185 [Monocercomonoides exilis]|uniref:uncharacterized protein n=1 Tax=Monocercomonoides exilis TaxID=2049356 RepID=UPI00355A7694|nr:hypothetical protein MONOS_14185 [Monocercomonoides exilis]|eukprot:MONOS_14185.1-p1 / transcript=MONOS_14185.1 / gene=MONOS_14185 / organism=Monocercomonoides_exilis_PA203 / gene_product=unspecified product / transcript_product=unspecified product / location=Mono_scaffold00952:621-1304(+) / protein_length=228 / sequence_SO=supercontig / SO=protein_coding / is_pseudo=false
MELRRDKSLKHRGEGKQPLVTFDVKFLIESIPDCFEGKAEEASLFLFALHVGARAITCGNVWLCDIRKEVKEDDGRLFVNVRLMRCKGSSNCYHPVTLEKLSEEDKSLDAVYWLRKFILNKFGLDLYNEKLWPLKENGDKLLWSYGTEEMRTRLKKRLELAGFPPEEFGFHSFRSCFLYSAILKAGVNREERDAVLETCALIAGCIPFSKSEMTYVKRVATRTIIAT